MVCLNHMFDISYNAKLGQLWATWHEMSGQNIILTVCKQVPFKKVCVSKSRSELVNCIFKYRIKGWQFKHAFASQKNIKLVQPPV